MTVCESSHRVQKEIRQGCMPAEQSGKATAGTAVCQSDSFRETPSTQNLVKNRVAAGVLVTRRL